MHLLRSGALSCERHCTASPIASSQSTSTMLCQDAFYAGLAKACSCCCMSEFCQCKHHHTLLLEGVAKLGSDRDYLGAVVTKVAFLAMINIGCLSNPQQAVELHHPPLQQTQHKAVFKVTCLGHMSGSHVGVTCRGHMSGSQDSTHRLAGTCHLSLTIGQDAVAIVGLTTSLVHEQQHSCIQ